MSDRGTTRRRSAAAGGVLAAILVGGAPAAAATVLHAVTIDCAGDVVTGQAQVSDPTEPAAGVVLSGWAGGTRTVLGRTTVHLQGNVTGVAYQFTLPRHVDSYQVTVTAGTDVARSDRITDSTCAPPVEVPEAGVALAVPVAMAVAGVAWWVRRQRAAR